MFGVVHFSLEQVHVFALRWDCLFDVPVVAAVVVVVVVVVVDCGVVVVVVAAAAVVVIVFVAVAAELFASTKRPTDYNVTHHRLLSATICVKSVAHGFHIQQSRTTTLAYFATKHTPTNMYCIGY